MGEIHKVNWNYYVKALQAFKMGEKLTTSKPGTGFVEYTYEEQKLDHNAMESESVTFIFKNLPEEVTCVSYYTSGQFVLKNNFCTKIVETKPFCESHLYYPTKEGVVFVRGLPEIPNLNRRALDHFDIGESGYLLIEGVKKLYNCYVQTNGNNQCAQETGVESVYAAVQEKWAIEESNRAAKRARELEASQRRKEENGRKTWEESEAKRRQEEWARPKKIW